MVETRRAKKIRMQRDTPELPADVWAGGIAPFVEDRSDWNTISYLTRDIYQAMKNSFPPWPKHLYFGTSYESFIDFVVSPNREWLVYVNKESDGPPNIIFYHCRQGPSGHCHFTLNDYPVNGINLKFSPQNQSILVSSACGLTTLIDLSTTLSFQSLKVLVYGKPGLFFRMAFSPDGKFKNVPYTLCRSLCLIWF